MSLNTQIKNHTPISAFQLWPTDLVEFVLQDTGVQAELVEGVLLHRLNNGVHLCVVLGRQMGVVDVRRDELFAQHTSA